MDYRQLKIDPEAHIAPNATILGNVELGRDVTVFAGATLRGDYGACIKVGDGTNIQEGVCVHLGATSPTTIGRGCTVGHGAIVHGCTIGDNVLVGMGSIVMDHAVIGDNCIIGAGALVTGGTQIPAGSLVIGSPAKVKRALTDEEIAANRVDAEEYVEDRPRPGGAGLHVRRRCRAGRFADDCDVARRRWPAQLVPARCVELRDCGAAR